MDGYSPQLAESTSKGAEVPGSLYIHFLAQSEPAHPTILTLGDILHELEDEFVRH